MAVFVSAIVVAIDVGTVAAVATAVAETGIALNVVGHLTGNQTLEKVGGVMSMAGGVVGLAAGAFSMAAGEAATTSLGGGAVDTATDSVSDFNDATNTLTNADGSVTSAGTQLPAANAVDTGANVGADAGANAGTNLGTNVGTNVGNNAGDLSGTAGGAANGAINGADPTLTNPSSITQTPLDSSGNALNPTGSTANPLSGNATSTGLNPTGSSNLTNGNYDPLNTGANNPVGNAASAPNSSASPFQGGPTTSNASTTLNANGGNSAFQLNNESTSTMLGQNANTTAPGTLVAGQSAPVSPGSDLGTPTRAASFNDANGTYTSPTGNTITVGQNAEQVTDAANDSKPGLLDGLTNWVKNNQTLTGQMVSGAMQGLGSAYAAGKQYELGTNQLALQQQIQANKSAQVAQQAPSGIISGARKKGNP